MVTWFWEDARCEKFQGVKIFDVIVDPNDGTFTGKTSKRREDTVFGSWVWCLVACSLVYELLVYYLY